jgi:hypothetical protein
MEPLSKDAERLPAGYLSHKGERLKNRILNVKKSIVFNRF